MSIINQINNSNLSKKGKKTTTGVFEGTPQNVALVRRGATYPTVTAVVPANINPIDVTFNAVDQSTYLDFLRSSPTR